MTSQQQRTPPPEEIALSTHVHDRGGARRTDDAWLARAWADARTRVLLLAGDSFPVDESGTAVAWTDPSAAPEGDRLFLGVHDGVAHFAVLLDQDPPEAGWAGLRAVGPTLSHAEAGLMVHALALSQWHAAHRFCPRCGGHLEVGHAGHLLTCAQCGRQQFPRTDPAVIMLVTDGEDRALLGRQARWPEGRFSTLAGFVEPGESLEAAVRREVSEEVGVEIGAVTYHANQPWPFPASLMIGFFASALSTQVRVDGEEIVEARWYTRERIRLEAESGTVRLPGRISISRSLIETWYGGELPGQW